MDIKKIIKRHNHSIALILAFLLLENTAWLIEPTFFGQLLDALINDFYHNKKVKIDYLLPLIMWVGIYLLNTLGGTLSRFYNGKVYAQMYVDIAIDVIVYSDSQGHSATRAMARAELAKEYVVFLKDRLPEVIWQITATFGVIGALFFYDWRIAFVCFAVIFPLIFLLKRYQQNVNTLQRDLHDSREDLSQFFEAKNVAGIREYYQNMVTFQTSISKWNALNYVLTKLLMMAIFIGVLFICIDVDQFSTGKIYAIVSYLWTFILSTDYLPGLMESITSITELNHRLGIKEESNNH